MPQTLSNTSTSENNDLGRRRHPYLLVELMVIIVVTGVLVWTLHNYPPRGPITQGLLNTKIWILVLLASTVGTAGSLIPYYVGQQGTQAIFAHYPKLEGKPWSRLEAVFKNGERGPSSCRPFPAWEWRSTPLPAPLASKDRTFSSGSSWFMWCATG